ncbi:Na+/H+ antiporter subunit A [Alkalihalobacillus pseudalcaliphilus]|uniref:Na+/H+ antiporter subunit A n=1 Tax=Alkalihalobacillus pseudalcaliphilus TaxID=79884 RepID=UPI00064DDC8C|nr:Na+/H+ antiporter subunit A [Alkalihalobacillus pseudalcaliphilus]KMK77196.1 cation:proton antiporter [Alkalihalobacillus pseudalcaliphilus]
MSILHLATLSPFIIALTIPFIYSFTKKRHIGWYILLVPIVLFIFFSQYIPQLSQGITILSEVQWIPSLDFHFSIYLDGLALLFVLLITGIGALVVFYSIFYLDKNKENLHQFYTYLLMFMGAMLGIVLSDNLIVLYVFWELTSLASALLISFWYQRDQSIFGARKSMLITVFGGFAMMAGFILLYLEANTFSIQSLIGQADTLVASPLFIPAMILVLLGAFTKSAQFPFHIWLPDAMEAPTPVSAYLHSATMVKAGIYLVARLTPVFGVATSWVWILMIVGLVTLTWGALCALRQYDLKGILAYSTISQLGLIMMLFGIGSYSMNVRTFDEVNLYATSMTAAVIHLINHATFKGSLFMTAGIVDHETGTRDIRKLGGLLSIMPVTFTISLIGLAAMAGIPPFNGFLSKEKFFTSLLTISEMPIHDSLGIMIPLIAWLASIITFVYCAIMLFRTFTGKFEPSNYSVKVHEAPIGMLISPIILGILVVVLGVFPNLLVPYIIEPTVASILPAVDREAVNIELSLWHGFELELFMSIGVILIGTFLFIKFPSIKKKSCWLSRERESLHRVYEEGIIGLDRSAKWMTKKQITGSLRDYMAYMLIFIIGIVAYAFIRSNSLAMSMEGMSPIEPYTIGLIALLVFSTLTMPFMKNRITLLINLGVIGLVLSLLFTLFSAQDLALTQLLVETVTIILLLLTFKYLPAFKTEKRSKTKKSVNIILSICVGVGVFLLGVSAILFNGDHDFTPVSQYYIENSYELGGGTNIVNVILVDFRALDTLLEVLVLGIVGLAIITMVKHRMGRREDV